MQIRKARVPGALYLLMAAMIWGGAFVAQSLGADSVAPLTFNAARSLVGALAIAPAFKLADRLRKDRARVESHNRALVWGGLACGALLAVAVNLQQFGIAFVEDAQKANVGKVGFLTTLYIVLVPIFGVFFRRRAGANVWLSVLIAVCGLYLLSVKDGFSVSRGDIYVFMCAVAFACQIMVVDAVAPRVDCLRLSCLQFLVCGVLSLAGALIFEAPNIKALASAWAPILYTGVMSSAVAYTFQIFGQRNCRPAVASLIMSLESVFAALFGFLLLGQTLGARELIGCGAMLSAALIAQAKH